MPTPIQIPRTASAPADPDAPSLITTLSADIRLLIFEVLFKRDGPFLLHNRDAYHAKDPLLHKNKTAGDRYRAIAQFDKTYLSEIGADYEFAHAHDMGIGILLSCRQIYHEGSAILYGGNNFTFSRVTTRHDLDPEDMHDDQSYHPFHYAAQWLWGIGSQHFLLKKVVLDTDAICGPYCLDGAQRFDILPLARFVWLHPKMEDKITFGRSGRVMLSHVDDENEYRSAEKAKTQCVQDLSYILSELVVKDSLSLKRYSSTRILDSIEVNVDSRRGVIQHFDKSSNRSFYDRVFYEDDQTARLELYPQRPVGGLPGLLKLIKRTDRAILQHFYPQNECITFDLDKTITHGLSLNHFQICRSLRKLFWPDYRSDDSYRSKDVVVRMTSHEVLTNFNAFTALRKLGLCELGEKRVRWSPIYDIVTAKKHGKARTSVFLKLDITSPSTLHMARIDIQHFVQPSLCFLDPQKTVVRVLLTYPCGRKVHGEEASTSLADLHRGIFHLLSDILHYFTANPKTVRGDLPSIWINGHGAIVRASFPATEMLNELSIDYAHGKLSRDELHYKGYSVAPHRVDSPMKRHLAHVGTSPLGRMWSRLFHTYWGDFSVREMSPKG